MQGRLIFKQVFFYRFGQLFEPTTSLTFLGINMRSMNITQQKYLSRSSVIKVAYMTRRKIIFTAFFLQLALGSTSGQDFATRVADSAMTLTRQWVQYDPSYFKIDYPNGDVPSNKGVCTDVVIRAYRKLGIDLQKEVHEDMKSKFGLYPKTWGLKRPDTNIDHRRVPNLMTFFGRHGTTKVISHNPRDYQPGDIVCWNLDGGITHIGIVSKGRSSDGSRFLIVHNIGAGQVAEDILFQYKIIGHYTFGK